MEKVIENSFKGIYIKVYDSDLSIHEVYSQLKDREDQYSVNNIKVKEDADVGLSVCSGEYNMVDFPAMYSEYSAYIDSVEFKLNSGDSIEVDRENLILTSRDQSLEIDKILSEKEKKL